MGLPHVDRAVVALADLRHSYARLFNSPALELNWRNCERAHERAVEALRSDELRKRIDPVVDTLRKGGHGNPAQAVSDLDDAHEHVVDEERRLGRRLGYPERFLRRHL